MKKNIVKNNLGYSGTLFVYQDKDAFNYSVDTILLGNFFSINRTVSNILEVGTNNGALSIFIASRSKKIKIDALEIQKDAALLAKKNVKLNKLESQINVINEDFNNYVKDYAFKCGNKLAKKYSAIVANPPYYKEEFNVPRTKWTDAKKAKYNFEPKVIQLVYPRVNDLPKFCLIESRYNSGWGTSFKKNLYLHYNDINNHEYTEEIVKLYSPIKAKDNEDEKK